MRYSTLLTVFSLLPLLITISARPQSNTYRRRHNHNQHRARRSRYGSSPLSSYSASTKSIKQDESTISQTASILPSSASASTSRASSVSVTNSNTVNASKSNSSNQVKNDNETESMSIGLWTPPSSTESDSQAGTDTDAQAGVQSAAGSGWGGGGGKKGGWGGWGGGGGGSPLSSLPGSTADAAIPTVPISIPASPLASSANPSAYAPTSPTAVPAPSSQSSIDEIPDASLVKGGGGYSPSQSSQYQGPTASNVESAGRPTIYSTNYVEVTTWYTPPVQQPSQVSSYQTGISGGKTDQGGIPTSQSVPGLPIQATATATYPSVQATTPVTTSMQQLPTPVYSANPTVNATTPFSYSTEGGYASSSIKTSNGQTYGASEWHSSWTDTWSNPPSTTSEAPVPTTAPQSDDSKKFVDCHNQWRQQYGAGNVSWGEDLASYAGQHASVCASMTHTNGPYGENLAVGTDGFIDILSGIGMWMDEASQYDPSSPTYSHFTQVVWKETNTIGCAAINCGANTGLAGQLYIMCEYHPRGNVIGAFAQNVGGKR
ncbi:uncharacterized protein IL334_006554 [Kwoniella shivajii]|uniref:SCP domain-containing protein n=1 Tax=Kwoniella shivajii TaxID=564305 RepID=A0ABZ1D690_9TREE|nr:hypothetical protein IL334_006554 [Kwoniella shivajii]